MVFSDQQIKIKIYNLKITQTKTTYYFNDLLIDN